MGKGVYVRVGIRSGVAGMRANNRLGRFLVFSGDGVSVELGVRVKQGCRSTCSGDWFTEEELGSPRVLGVSGATAGFPGQGLWVKL